MPQRDGDPIGQQLIAARRNQILDAATKVFAEKGFSRATIRDVATAAGVADGTIYNYFENKMALLLGLLNRLNETDQRPAHFTAAREIDLAEFVESYVKHRFERLDGDNLRVLQVLLAEMLVNRELRELYYRQVIEPTFALTEQYFEQCVAEGRVTPADPQLTPRIFAGMALGVLVLRLMGDQYLEAQWQAVPDAISAFALHGLLPPKGDDDATAPEP